MRRSGLPCGAGELRFPDGSKYVGEVVDGRATGVGRYVATNGDVSASFAVVVAVHEQLQSQPGCLVLLFLHCVEQVTEGEFKDGLLNGQGARYYSNGTVRFGTWRNGMMVRMLLH